jgi:hypothetical protein
MNIPGFTAEAALTKMDGPYHITVAFDVPIDNQKVVPQWRKICIVLSADDFWMATGIKTPFGGGICY